MERPPAIFGIGKNYADHAAEMRGEVPKRPVVFMKNPASIIGNDEPIIIPRICAEPQEQVDYEGELAVILGRDCRDVEEDDALGCVGGYAIANDVSARWWQKEGSGGQFIRGKSFDTFCPISEPVAAAEVPDPQALSIRTTVSGELMQDGHTSRMIFPVARLIAELSRGTTLLKGTVILTGTPSGVGFGRTPPRFLKEDDVVEVSIDGLGTLRNEVRSEDRAG
ncbi:MAG: fumarylacetoacetate hydrolase family protein [Phycisphaerales bacterium]|nr:MAG: fumarylacetoacetate hydrolase family protein [Phycisphaerales bacterium]